MIPNMVIYNIPFDKNKIRVITEEWMKDNRDCLSNIPLYLDIWNGNMEDEPEVSSHFHKNLFIGNAMVNMDRYEYIVRLYPSSIGNLAISMTDTILKHGFALNDHILIAPRSYFAIETVYRIKWKPLGVIHEDFFSAYFTGKTVRQYAYDKDINYNTKGIIA